MMHTTWSAAPLGIISDVTLGKMVQNKPSDTETLQLPYLHAANVRDGGILDTVHSHRTMWFSPSEASSLSISAGDVIVVEGGAVGKSAYVKEDLRGYGFQNSVLRVKGKNGVADGRFIQYCLQSSFDLGEIARECSAVSLAHFPAEKAKRFRIPFPPLKTQQRIADYLDRETAEIDAAVADLDRYMELLKKRRRAIAVSAIFPHGFPKNLLSAQSYLDLGYNSVIRIGAFAKLRKTRNSDQDAQYLSLMKGIGVILYEEKGNVGNKKPQDLSDAFVVEAGDYLVNSMNFKIGSFGRSRYAGVASGAYLIFSVDDNVVNPDFLQYVFENDDLRSQAQNLGNGILEHRKSINWDRFRSIYLPHPSREEQDAVVESLRKQTAEIDALVEESTKLRNLLLKRRSVLITEVVTGRKQV